MGNVSASEDAKRYRDGYPGKEDDPKIKTNLEFYQNKRSSKPEGDTIENIHKKWFGKYGLLEAHHGYIQWLFPIREDGMNHYADQLQLHEAKVIASDTILQGRVITSYELMLDFYGIKLVDRKTGVLQRNSNWKERYQHLNRSFHNYLRITRILKCLGEMELEHFKLPFVKFLLNEVYENHELSNCRESLVKYWTPVLRKEADLKEAFQIIEKYEGNNTRNSNSNRNYVSHQSDSESEEEEEKEKEKEEKEKEEKEEKETQSTKDTSKSDSIPSAASTSDKVSDNSNETKDNKNQDNDNPDSFKITETSTSLPIDSTSDSNSVNEKTATSSEKENIPKEDL